MALTAQRPSGGDYTAEFVGIAHTQLVISAQDLLTWANETLEAYGESARGHFPAAAAATDFTAIRLEVGGAPANHLLWTPRSDHPETGSHLQVIDGAAVDGHVRITYA
jgi:hypothetical protein